MTTVEAAARVGIDPANIRQAIARGTLKATKRGRDWDITEAALAAWRAKVERGDK